MRNHFIVRMNEDGSYERDYYINEEGEKVYKSIVFSPNSVYEYKVQSSLPTDAFIAYSSSVGRSLFVFLADNTIVEFGMVQTLEDASYIMTQHGERGIYINALATGLDNMGNTVTNVIHSHPGNSIPSGFNDNDKVGDRFAAKQFQTSQGNPVNHYVYSPKTGGIIKFNYNGYAHRAIEFR